MAVIFCVTCGTRNEQSSFACTKCGRFFLPTDFVELSNWEEVKVKVAKPAKVQEQADLTLWQQAKRRPFVSLTGASVIFFFLGFIFWFFFYPGGMPRCLEYRDYECTFITLERSIKNVDLKVIESSNLNSKSMDRVKAEALDLLRLMAISRNSQNIVTMYSVLNNSAKNDNWVSNCFDIESCKTIGATSDIDFEGATGSLGLTFDGALQTAEFVSPTSARPIWNFRSVLSKKSNTIPDRGFLVTEVHLVSNDLTALKILHPVANQFREELRQAGIDLRVLVTLESYSRNSKKNVARIVLKRFQDPLRPFDKTIRLELGTQTDQDIWSVNLGISRDQILAVVSAKVIPSGSSILFADCTFNPFEENEYLTVDEISVSVVCVGSNRYREMIREFQNGKVVDKLSVIGGFRESKIVARLNLDLPRALRPIFILRL